jgi:hypothetical protein
MKKLLLLTALVFCTNIHAQTIINAFAGNGTTGFSGDGGQATTAKFYEPTGIAADMQGNVYIVDWQNNRIRVVNTNGIINTFAGNSPTSCSTPPCLGGFSGDGGPAVAAELYYPAGVATDAMGNVYIADAANNRIRMVNTAGIISTIAGSGPIGNGAGAYNGDGGPATSAQLNFPIGVALDTVGNIYIADCHNGAVRKVNTVGIISTVATSMDSYGTIVSVATDALGNVYFNDCTTTEYLIRKVNTSGSINIVTYGIGGFSGDGGPATNAEVNLPQGLTTDAQGNLYIADKGNYRIRVVNTAGIINTFAGNGTFGNSGDGGPATAAELYEPFGLGTDALGHIYMTDYYDSRIRMLTPPCPTVTLSITGNDTICAGTTTTLTASGATSYTWSNGTTTASIAINPNADTVYFVKASSGGGCTNYDTVSVTVIPISLTPSTNSYTLCSGGFDTLGVNGASTYTWVPSTNLSNANSATPIANPTATTIYTVTGTNACGNSSPLTIMINVNPTPTLSILSVTGDSISCGDTVILYVMGANTYTWAAANAITSPNSVNLIATPTTTTIYTVTGTNICGMSSMATYTVTFSNGILPTDSFYILPDSIPHFWDLYIYYSSNVVNARWYWGDGTDTLALYPTHSYATAGMYNICITAYSPCGDSASYCQNDSIYRTTNNTMVYVHGYSGVTGIQTYNNQNPTFHIYPNPTTGMINIEGLMLNDNISICDVLSNELINTKQKSIDVSNLQSGVYLIKTKQGTTKFIKQ